MRFIPTNCETASLAKSSAAGRAIAAMITRLDIPAAQNIANASTALRKLQAIAAPLRPNVDVRSQRIPRTQYFREVQFSGQIGASLPLDKGEAHKSQAIDPCANEKNLSDRRRDQREIGSDPVSEKDWRNDNRGRAYGRVAIAEGLKRPRSEFKRPSRDKTDMRGKTCVPAPPGRSASARRGSWELHSGRHRQRRSFDPTGVPSVFLARAKVL
jgi:hypothetical protein